MTGVLLDFETADRITLDNLKDCRKRLKKELKEHKKGAWLHPDDVVGNMELIRCMDKLIHYFGG